MEPTVLVACDSADDDRSPVDFARTLAQPLGARVELVTVCASTNPPELLAGAEGDDEPLRAPAEWRVLRAASAAAGLQGVIAQERPEFVVLGSAHGAAYGRIRVGSTAERVLHGSARALAVVPRDHAARRLGAIGVGLLPSDEGLRALRAGAALAAAASVPLVVLSVLRHSPDAADAAAFAARLSPAVEAGAHSPAHVLRTAMEAAARAVDPRVEVDARVVVGDAADALVRLSVDLGLLVLGSRAYGPPGVVLPGGAARHILAGARCPVMLVPRAEVYAPGAA